MEYVTIKNCPVKTSLKYVGKRWTLELVRDMVFGKKRFKDFIDANPRLTSKVLAQRLKELEINQIVNKTVYEESNRTEYTLTVKGYRLSRVLYELAMFSYEFYPTDIFEAEILPLQEMEKWAKEYLAYQ